MLEREKGFAYLICRSLAYLGNSWAQQNYPRRTITFVFKNDYCQLAKISRQQLEGRFNWELREFVSGEDWVKEKESSARAMRRRESIRCKFRLVSDGVAIGQSISIYWRRASA